MCFHILKGEVNRFKDYWFIYIFCLMDIKVLTNLYSYLKYCMVETFFNWKNTFYYNEVKIKFVHIFSHWIIQGIWNCHIWISSHIEILQGIQLKNNKEKWTVQNYNYCAHQIYNKSNFLIDLFTYISMHLKLHDVLPLFCFSFADL